MKRRGIHKALFGMAILFLVWIVCCESGRWSSYILPSPGMVCFALIDMIKSGELEKNIVASMIRIGTGFTIAFFLAFVTGVVTGMKKSMEKYYEWIISFLRHIPPLSLIPLFILWFGIGEMTKIIIIVMSAFFPMFLNIRKGILSCDPKLLEVGEIFGFSKRELFLRIRLPYAFPDILAGVRIGMGYSFRAIIGAEMIAASCGIGYMILDAQMFARTDKIIAGVIVIGILGMLCDWLFGILIRVVKPDGERYLWD